MLETKEKRFVVMEIIINFIKDFDRFEEHLSPFYDLRFPERTCSKDGFEINYREKNKYVRNKSVEKVINLIKDMRSFDDIMFVNKDTMFLNDDSIFVECSEDGFKIICLGKETLDTYEDAPSSMMNENVLLIKVDKDGSFIKVYKDGSFIKVYKVESPFKMYEGESPSEVYKFELPIKRYCNHGLFIRSETTRFIS